MAAKKAGRDEAQRNGGIEIRIHQHRPLADRFQMLPNALLRGDCDPDAGYDFRGYTLRERALLGALAGMAEGYRCSRARIESLAPELGVDALDTVLRGLREKGHLRQTRINDPDSGKFVWRWDVSLDRVFATPTEEETAGRTMGGLSTHGSSTLGSAMGGQSGSKYLEDHGVLEDQEDPPVPPASGGARPDGQQPQTPPAQRRPCGRAHAPDAACRACRTNPRAVALAHTKPPRPPWCGQCHRDTRLLEDEVPARRCPACHPRAQRQPVDPGGQ